MNGPIGWVRGNGNVVVVATDKIGGFAELSGNGLQATRSWHDELPEDAVPLVREDEARDVNLPALDSIEALQYAADVCDLVSKKSKSVTDMDLLNGSGFVLREWIATADADAQRERNIETLAERGYEAWRAIFNRDIDANEAQWCAVNKSTKTHWLSWAREMRKDGAA